MIGGMLIDPYTCCVITCPAPMCQEEAATPRYNFQVQAVPQPTLTTGM